MDRPILTPCKTPGVAVAGGRMALAGLTNSSALRPAGIKPATCGLEDSEKPSNLPRKPQFFG